MPTADYSLDDVTAAVLSIGGPGLTTETDLVKKKNTCFLHTMIDLPFVYVMHNKILLKSTKCRFIRREGTVNEVHYDFHHVIYFTTIP